MQEYPVGTKEYFVVDVTDRLGNLTSLDGYTLTYTVKEKESGTAKYTNAVATNDDMKILCLIDTSTGTWEVGVYQLWATILASPEAPKLGPFEFRLRSD